MEDGPLVQRVSMSRSSNRDSFGVGIVSFKTTTACCICEYFPLKGSGLNRSREDPSNPVSSAASYVTHEIKRPARRSVSPRPR